MLATGGNRKVEIFDVQQSTEAQACNLFDFPINLENAVATMFDNTPWICGGIENTEDFSKKCFSLDMASRSWKSRLNSTMKKSRSQSAATLIRNKHNKATVSIICMSSCRFKSVWNEASLL